MIPIEKVKLIVNKYETLEKKLASGDFDKGGRIDSERISKLHICEKRDGGLRAAPAPSDIPMVTKKRLAA